MKACVDAVMKRWDSLLEQYEFVNIRSLLGGRVKYGYPPFVRDVDIWLPQKASFLQDIDLIMSVKSTSGREWSLAARGVKMDEVHAFPCGNRVLIGEWVVDIRLEDQIFCSPLSFNKKIISNEQAQFVMSYDPSQVLCLRSEGQTWLRRGLFEGDLFSAEISNNRIICIGQIDYLTKNADQTLELDLSTGRVIAGDKAALQAKGKLVAPSDIFTLSAR